MENIVPPDPTDTAAPRRANVGRRVLLAVVVVLALLAAAVTYIRFAPLPHYDRPAIPERHVTLTPERVARGKTIATVRCLLCHVDPMTKKASGRLLAEIPANLARAYSVNITNDRASGIGAWTDGELAYTLRTGIGHDGHLLPPWMPRLTRMSDDDLDALIAFLRSNEPVVQAVSAPNLASNYTMLGKALMRLVWGPDTLPRVPIAAPPAGDRLAYGRYLVRDLAECWSCHSADFKKLNQKIPEESKGYLAGGSSITGMDGIPVIAPNITPDSSTGLGRWSAEQFNHALRFSVLPDGAGIRYPMPRYAGFSDEEVAAMFTYLRSVAPVHGTAAAQQPASSESGGPAAAASAGGESAQNGKEVYARYGCFSCHGEAGVAMVDLRNATRDFPTDKALEAFIRHPSEVRPGISMPSFDGIIKENEFPALLRYVRELCARPR